MRSALKAIFAVFALSFLLAVIFAGCGKTVDDQIIDNTENISETSDMKSGYVQIDAETAMEMMERDDGHIIVDVRREDEYHDGHIPGAVLIPNESITDEMPALLPDPDQIILIYCRSGRRSKEAAAKLADMGYKNVYEFGGIIDWPGEIVKEETAETETDEENSDVVIPSCVLVIKANGKTFYANFEENSSAQAFIDKLSVEPIIVEMHDYGNFEKVGPLPWDLPRNDTSITTRPGDVILYQGDQITVYYDENSWTITKLASIGSATREALIEAFGSGDVTVTFSVEWSE
jgi:rhodanese-related sulfurtransferase